MGAALSTAGRVGSYAQQAWDFTQGGMQAIQQAQQFAAALGLGGQRPSSGQPSPAATPDAGVGAGGPTTPQPATAAAHTTASAPAYGPGVAPQPHPGMAPPASLDQIVTLLQALQQRQIPALPGGTYAPGPTAATPARSDAFGLLRVLLTNPQLQHALQSAPTGAVSPPGVQLPVPVAAAAPTHVRTVQIPIGAVLNALSALSGRAMTELNENVSEEEPEIPGYLVGDDGDFIVDPASADDRAALVAHLFLLSDAAQRLGWQLGGAPAEADVEIDESDAWALDAGIR